jgi:flagellin
MRINTNIEALNAQRNLSATANTFATSVEKLSSGLRINRAADDAAGLAISQKLQAQVTGLNQAQRNAQDGVSMVQTAEGALTEVHSMLLRIRELAVEAANSTVGTADAVSVNTEITNLQAEINRIAQKTTFNGQYLLTGAMSVSQDTAAANSLKVGTAMNTGSGTSSVATIEVTGAGPSTTYTITSQAGGKVTLTNSTSLVGQQVTLDATIGTDGTETINFGQLGIKITVVGAAGKTAADLATDLATAANANIVTGAGTGALFQIGANEGDTMSVSFSNAQTASFGTAPGAFDTAISSFGSAPGNATAGALITQVDAAMASVSTIRGNFGAVQNRLQHTIASVSVAAENLNASNSRIKDLDIAGEMVNFTKTQILQQAGTAILAQANSAPQNVLTLLR